MFDVIDPFYVSLFRLYQVRCSLKVSPGKLPIQIETCIPDQNANNQTTGSCIINGAGVSKVFQILYRNEEVSLRDVIMFRAHLLGNLQCCVNVSLVTLMTLKWQCINHYKINLLFITFPRKVTILAMSESTHDFAVCQY